MIPALIAKDPCGFIETLQKIKGHAIGESLKHSLSGLGEYDIAHYINGFYTHLLEKISTNDLKVSCWDGSEESHEALIQKIKIFFFLGSYRKTIQRTLKKKVPTSFIEDHENQLSLDSQSATNWHSEQVQLLNSSPVKKCLVELANGYPKDIADLVSEDSKNTDILEDFLTLFYNEEASNIFLKRIEDNKVVNTSTLRGRRKRAKDKLKKLWPKYST